MSRKPTGRTIKKEQLASIAVTPKFKEAAEKRSTALEMTMSEYIRRLIEKDLKEGIL